MIDRKNVAWAEEIRGGGVFVFFAPGLRDAPSGTPIRRVPTTATRDPETERAAFDGFAAGLAAASRQTTGTTESTKEGT